MKTVNTSKNKNALLLDALIVHLQCGNDAKLARKLDISPAEICKVRSGQLKVGPTLLIRIHELTGLSIAEMKGMLEDDGLLTEKTTSIAAAIAPPETPVTPPKKPTASGSADVGHLLDALLAKLQLKNDSALAHRLGVTAPVISKIRHNKLDVGPTILLRMHEVSGFSFEKLRQLMLRKKVSQRIYMSPAERQAKLTLLLQKVATHEGGQCFASEYVNSITSMRFICRKHGIFHAQPRHILHGRWCRLCSHDQMKGDAPERLLRYITERGGHLKSPYINTRTHVVVNCPIHGDWRALPDKLLNKGSWCVHCARSKPRPERKKKDEPSAQ